MSIDRIAVVGGGTMGNGIAHVAAQSGKSVKLLDISEEVLTSAMATIGTKRMNNRNSVKNRPKLPSSVSRSTQLGR